ncbi:MAG TPA: serine/threonine-protein kinase [Bryobacteraceae bacterium]|nr:serine/threonine-protein kinase [Bryobacteraceae bacterium]
MWHTGFYSRSGFMVGRTVHHYQFLEKLGAGGMGEIWKAQDTRLNRIVAVKVLTSASAGDPERRRRFIQEAQAASALNHPNIITIHDIISEGDAEFMVMEFVQGKTLIDLIPKGGLRVPQVLKYAVQMTDALQAAHSAGIIHRDLKPGNVMVTETGLVKVLDFGLAKLTDSSPLSQTGSSGDDATRTIAEAPLTVEGSIIGTVSYMSPEQAQGRKVDSRSDIFSFAVVLYEMVTGTRAFAGDSALSTLSAILRDEARPIPEIAPDTPPQLEHVIHRCLRKQPDQRFQTMREVQAALGALKHESDSGMLYRTRAGMEPWPKPKRSTLPLGMTWLTGAGAAVVVLAIAGGGAWWWTHRTPKTEPAPQIAAQTNAQPAPVPAEAPAAAPAPPGVPVDQALTNDNIVQMLEAKVSQAIILSQIRNSKTAFNLSAQEVIRLSKARVPENIIEAMRDPKAVPVKAAAPPVSPAATPVAPPAPVSASSSSPGPAAAPAPPEAVPAVSAAASRPAVAVTLSDGMAFSITLAEDIPQNAEEGRQIHFTVAKDVRAGDLVAIAKGAPVSGEVAQAARKGTLGFGGSKAMLRLLVVDAVDGKKYRVRAQSARSADGKNERSVETNVKPKNKELAAEAGTEYVAYIDGDVTISVKK